MTLKIQKHDNIWFTSDYHLGHQNIIKFSNRPFADVLGMNEAIRDNHNKVCDDSSIIFNLGDAILLPKVADRAFEEKQIYQMESLIKTFKGKVYYIPGNHEHDILCLQKYWHIQPPLIDLLLVDKPDNNTHIVLCHYCIRAWNKAHHGSWHLFGHSHGGLKMDDGTLMTVSTKGRCMDVGVDTNNYFPYSFKEIEKIMANKVFIPSDHHVGRH